MRTMGLQPKKGEVEAMIAEVDADGSGSIDFEEFVGLMSSKIGNRGRIPSRCRWNRTLRQ